MLWLVLYSHDQFCDSQDRLTILSTFAIPMNVVFALLKNAWLGVGPASSGFRWTLWTKCGIVWRYC